MTSALEAAPRQPMEFSFFEKQRAAQFRKFSEYAAGNGGVLLSTQYTNSTTCLEFQCGAGHKFSSPPSSMWHKQSWCKACAATANRANQLSDRNMLQEIQDIAAQRGGACLSPEYVRADTKLTFSCADGHTFDSRPNDIRRGNWCPSCVNKTESMVRRYLECIFDTALPARRLPWLVDGEGKHRILDGYSEHLQFAFEYHGAQHFEHIKFFHTGKSLEQQQDRDAFVREACVAAGVMLVEIPTVPVGCNQDEFVAHVDEALAAYSALPAKMPGGLARFLSMPERTSKLTEMTALASARGGRCLATKFLSMRSKLTWQCADGHTWSAIPSTIKSGHWCPFCSNCRREKPLDDLRKFAEERGGKCLSTTYVNSTTPHSFVCANDHTFACLPKSIWGQKSWCKSCAIDKTLNPLKRLQEAAQARGGTLLSTTYVNSHKKVQLQCQKGHVWSTTPASIIHSKSWCKTCMHQGRVQKAAPAPAAAKTYAAPPRTSPKRPAPSRLFTPAESGIMSDGYSPGRTVRRHAQSIRDGV